MSSKWLSLEHALEKAISATRTIGETETIPLNSALGRITASAVSASISVPPWDNSAMDGFAVNTADEKNTPLLIQSTITAGMAANESLKSGHAIKIMTGAPVPAGADAVVMVENTTTEDNGVVINQWPSSGENIRKKEADIKIGQALVNQGVRLQPQHLMLLSSQGLATVEVFKQVKVGVVATGTELAQPGEPCLPTQIYESNRIGVSALLSELGVEIIDFGIVKDDEQSLTSLFKEASERVDVMVSSGGVSVGDADYVKDVIDTLGSIDFWKVAIKPGKPFALGQIANTLFCGLPGNPVSAFVTAKLLVTPLIRKMQGEQLIRKPLTVNAKITCDIKRRAGRRDFQRATMSYDDNFDLCVTPFRTQSSGVMTSITAANCLMIIHEDISHVEKGTTLPVIPFDLLSPEPDA
ncbi:molybdopterin molybdotransferase MoeA [Alteromonas sp. 1_MG-2023]|uniref:molybdopterin molybdotransferase MoeA n=1 Tax=Alteromonas sp. 1_MG-2023 TaxID=3062669 RepID=UPI0026E14038|nr:gephyrin-like molybdotransferase Glp [Alteromonas sp. 1_MG-2023]MDO6569131.1 molybdopterin molybdotransferase MoeA [Alteromonas sp. 1_MG-2023]